jgi:hypothetical protein
VYRVLASVLPVAAVPRLSGDHVNLAPAGVVQAILRSAAAREPDWPHAAEHGVKSGHRLSTATAYIDCLHAGSAVDSYRSCAQ